MGHPTWSRVLRFWDGFIQRRGFSPERGLELGSRHGGLSLHFALTYGSEMVCSDYGFPSDLARERHREYGIEKLISYADVNAVSIPFADHTFDFVVFKSVLGVVGRMNQYDRQQAAMREMWRVLKPGGVLLFAENALASPLHRYARRWFVSWGKSWRYVSFQEMEALAGVFSEYELYSTGFFSAFVRGEGALRRMSAQIDLALEKMLPSSWRYVLYGGAVK